ncbi:MAG: hypothetical protein JSU99_09465, partial [Nitrospiraceae bacterium]
LCAAIKWPNDILLQNKKRAGILLETRTSGISYDLIALGIGLNVNMTLDSFPGDIKHSATSLLIEGKKEIDRSALPDDILAALDSDLRVLASGGQSTTAQGMAEIQYDNWEDSTGSAGQNRSIRIC